MTRTMLQFAWTALRDLPRLASVPPRTLLTRASDLAMRAPAAAQRSRHFSPYWSWQTAEGGQPLLVEAHEVSRRRHGDRPR